MPLRVSLAPSGVLEGGRPGPVSSLPGFGLRAPRGVGLRVRGVPAPGGGVGVGGAACAPRPPFVRPGGPVRPGVALPCSVPLPSLGRQQSRCHWRRSGHGGRGPHTAPVCAPLPSLGAARVAPWRVGARSFFPRGSCGSRRLGRGGGPCSGPPLGRCGPVRGRGDDPQCLGRVGAGAPRGLRAGGGVGGWGGGRAAAPLLSLWGAARCSLPCPPSCRRRIPPRRARSVGVTGPPCAPGAACLAGGGGAAREPLPRGPRQTQDLPPSSPSGQHCGCHRRCSDNRGRSPHTALVCRCVPPPGVARVPLRRAGAGWPVVHDPPGSRRRGALGRAACGSSCAPPPCVAVPSGGAGASPRLEGGGGSALLRPAGREGIGGGGGALHRSPPPCPCHPLSQARPPGVYLSCGGWRAAVGVRRGPVGRQWVSAAGGRGRGGE